MPKDRVSNVITISSEAAAGEIRVNVQIKTSGENVDLAKAVLDHLTTAVRLALTVEGSVAGEPAKE